MATDASATGLGAVVFQFPEDIKAGTTYESKLFGRIQIVRFLSYKMSDAETRYTIPEKEMLAVVKALGDTKWFTSSSSYPIKIYTDHRSIIETIVNLGEVYSKVSR